MPDYRAMVEQLGLLSQLQPVADKFNPLNRQLNPLAGTEGARGGGTSRGLVVAQKLPDGTVKYGEPGETHGSLVSGMDLGRLPESYSVDANMGFAFPGGKFMTREQALQTLDANTRNKLSPWNAKEGLAAEEYNDVVSKGMRYDARSRRYVPQ
jgi:hypothetical protein